MEVYGWCPDQRSVKPSALLRSEVASWSVTITTHHIEAHCSQNIGHPRRGLITLTNGKAAHSSTQQCVSIWSVAGELIETGRLVIVNVVIGGCEANAQAVTGQSDWHHIEVLYSRA
jgi:hypothetical protein